MKTPKEYVDNCKNGIITYTMLSDCLFSVNKRAKNYRDKERQYRRNFDYYHNEEKNREKKEELYSFKETMLKIVQPTCIHRETQMRRNRIYDYMPDYEEHLENGDFIHEGSYYDRYTDSVVYFGDISEPVDAYYLFYDFGNRSFHTPISDSGLENYNIPIIAIDSLKTYGHEISDLLSLQFCKKILDLIQKGNYVLMN